MALAGWNPNNKLKLTIDSSKIEGDLTNFPINVTLSSGTGQTGYDTTAVFDELTTVTGTKKIAITDSNDNKLYTEIERWDWINEEANLWVKVPTIVSGTDTDLYLYYDATASGQNVRTLAEASDDFTGTDGDPPNIDLWGVLNIASSNPTIQSNKLYWSASGAADQQGITTSNFKLSGDFDIQVDWNNISRTEPSSSTTYLAWLRIFTADAYESISNVITSSQHLYQVNGTSEITTYFDTTEYSGKFRFKRVGTTITAYHWSDSQWEWDGNVAGYTFVIAMSGDIQIQLGVTADFYGATESTFDNFIVNSADYISGWVGDIGDTPAQNVWDSNFKAVYHMSQDPSGGSGAIKDSTVNVCNGTTSGTMLTEDLVDGKVGKAIAFDGSDDIINCGTNVANNFTTALTLEGIFKISEVKTQFIVAKDDDDTPNRKYELHVDSDQSIRGNVYEDNSNYSRVITNDGLGGSFIDGNYHHAALTIDTVVATSTPSDGLYLATDASPTSATLTTGRTALVNGTGCEPFDSDYNITNATRSVGFDLGSSKTISKIKIWGHGIAAKTYESFRGSDDDIEVYKSENNSSWTLAEAFVGMNGLSINYGFDSNGCVWWTLTFATPQTGRYFKLNTATYGLLYIYSTGDIFGHCYITEFLVTELAVGNIGKAILYVDGVLNVTSTGTIGSIQSQPSLPVIIGDRYNESGDYNFKGILDEIRLSSTQRTSEWIKATYYNNWNDLISFSEGSSFGQIVVNDEWKSVSSAKIVIDDVWKDVSEIQIVKDEEWKLLTS